MRLVLMLMFVGVLAVALPLTGCKKETSHTKRSVANTAENKPVENMTTENKPTENGEATANKPAETKPAAAETKPSEVKAAKV